MNIFDKIGKDIIEFKKYLGYCFEITYSMTVATREVEFSFEEFTAELLYPKHAENRATTQVATTLVSEAVSMIVMELTDTLKSNLKKSCI